MGGGFANRSYPRGNASNPHSNVSIANNCQNSQKDYGILDDYLTYKSPAASALSSVSLDGGELNTYHFSLGLNSTPLPPSPTEIDESNYASRLNSVEVLSIKKPLTCGSPSIPSNSLQEFGSQLLNCVNTSEESSPKSSMTTGSATLPQVTRFRTPSSEQVITYRSSSGPFICDIDGCHRSYKRVHEMRRHKRVHSSTKPHACIFTNCRRSGRNGFSRKDHLRQHLRQVHGVS
ncbi:hypothetical protein F5882DRAFT_403377 [Hyaloscypha sp. PMI_1271]|nr:hypothetical protein F5882DRAFT_403377 [Hyaloscypha sp. PMI_1271]